MAQWIKKFAAKQTWPLVFNARNLQQKERLGSCKSSFDLYLQWHMHAHSLPYMLRKLINVILKQLGYVMELYYLLRYKDKKESFHDMVSLVRME